MAVPSENSAHTRSLLVQLSFARNSGEELVTACRDDLNTANTLVPSQSYSGHAKVESALPSVEEGAA